MNRRYHLGLIIAVALAPLALPLGAQPAISGRDSARVRVLFGGDTCYGESYQEEYARSGGRNILVENGYDYCVVNLAGLLGAVDFRILNLETPLTRRRDGALAAKEYVHYSDPVKLPEIFGRYGPVAYSLANNHTLDQGVGGLEDTIIALKAARAQWFGAGHNLGEAARPLVQELRVGGSLVTLAVFGAFEYDRKYDARFHIYAGVDSPGTAVVDVPGVQRAIVNLRQQVPGVYVVYFVHREANYRWKDARQAAELHALREAGVDLVVCAGAHMMQEVEYDGSGWIFYGLGNFLFNASGRYAANQAPPYSLPLVVDFSMKNGRLRTGLRVYPIVSDNRLTSYQPRLVNKTELAAVEGLLAEKSGWDAPCRAAVKPGADEVGSYLEFLPPSPSPLSAQAQGPAEVKNPAELSQH